MQSEQFAPRLARRAFHALTLIACGLVMTGCVSLGLPAAARRASTEQATPPQRQLPDTAKEPCALYVLPKTQETPSLTDLEVGYILRGAQVAVCDSKRGLAVTTHEGEHADELAWRNERAKRECPWYRFGTCRAKP